MFYGSTLNGDSLLFSLTKGLNPNNGLSGGLSSSLNPLEQNSLATDKDKNALTLRCPPNRDNILLRKNSKSRLLLFREPLEAILKIFEKFEELERHPCRLLLSLSWLV